MSITEAKAALDKVITKARVHFYKPIQIAEILYHHRIDRNFDLGNLSSYRTQSKRWRQDMAITLVGRDSTSSSKYQDDVFNEDAMPPRFLKELGEVNVQTDGMIEAYIYRRFADKHSDLSNAIDFVRQSTPADFYLAEFLEMFNERPGLRRSIDKIYEIIVYALFDTMVEVLEAKVSLTVDEEYRPLVQEFEDFTKLVLGIDSERLTYSTRASLYRVGVTNAADRGLDMWANFGPAIQVKHLSLDVDIANSIVGQVDADRIVIVCKDCDARTIDLVIRQTGDRRIQGIVTERQLEQWYDKALRGQYSENLGPTLLESVCMEIEREFPSDGQNEIAKILDRRGYDRIRMTGIWA